MKLKCKCRGRQGMGLLVLHRPPPGWIEFGQRGQPGKVKAVPWGLSDRADLPKNSSHFYKARHSKVQAERLTSKNLLAILVPSEVPAVPCTYPSSVPGCADGSRDSRGGCWPYGQWLGLV